MVFRAPTLIALSAVTLLSGCSAFRNYDSELAQTNQQLATGNVDAALTLLEKNNTGPDKDLLYYFEKGELLRAKGDLSGSQNAWTSADQVVGKWEDSVKLDTDKYLAQFGSFLVNDKVRRYEGYDYEKVMLTTQMALNLLALNLLALNDFDGARTEIKKTHEREAVIADLRDKEYLKREDEAEKQGVKTEYKDLKGYPVEALDAPDVVNLKNSYQSAFSHYLAGFVYEALGEKDLAAPGYRKAAELRPNTPLLEQALVNILENAIAYSPDGSTIELAAFEDRSAVVISIEDEGRGIPSPELERVFDKFRRMEESSDRASDRVQGAGLGLAIAQRLTRLLGGVLEVQSTPGQGTTFTARFVLPVRVDGNSVSLLADDSEELPQLTGKVLLVEDEDPVRKLAQRALDLLERRALGIRDLHPALAMSVGHPLGQPGAHEHRVHLDPGLGGETGQQRLHQPGLARGVEVDLLGRARGG